MVKKIIILENYLQENNIKKTVYPITIIKYLLNKKLILSMLKNDEFVFKYSPFSIENKNCKSCNEKICRGHYSINRVIKGIKSDKIIKDINNNIFLYKNEIFNIISNNKMVIIHCPHTKLIQGKLNQNKVKYIYPINIIDESVGLINNYLNENKNIIEIDFNNIFEDKITTCWFDNVFTIKVNKIKNQYRWSLILNS